MAAKSLPFKKKPNIVNDNTQNGQYNNLNLNQSHQDSSNAFSELSKNVSTRNVLNFVQIKTIKTAAASSKALDFAINKEPKKDSHLWKKSTKVFPSNFVNDGSEKYEGFKKGGNSKATNNSTLSLHIKAYENSFEDGTSDFLFDGKSESLKQNSKQNFIDQASVNQNSFEFPRQQESDDGKMPEISQFKASQRLLNPNSNQINQVCDMFVEEKQYQELVKLEHQLDQIIQRKRIQNQSLLKQPIIISKRIRIFISHVYHRLDSATQIPKWELRIEGRLTDDCSTISPILPPSHQQSTMAKLVPAKADKRFSDFFSRVQVELDPSLYGTTQNVIEWKRDPAIPSDGCVITRNGDSDIRLKIRFWPQHDPQKFKIHPYVAKILGFAYGTKNNVCEALFLYIRTQKLQDSQEIEWVNCDHRLKLIFGVARLKMIEISLRIQRFLFLPDPVIIEHTIRVIDKVKPMIACYELDVEINDTFQSHNNDSSESFGKVVEDCDLKIRDSILKIKRSKELYDAATYFSNDPVNAINDFIKGQSSDLQTMKGDTYASEPARRVEPYLQQNMEEAVNRYIHQKIGQKRAELEAGVSIK